MRQVHPLTDAHTAASCHKRHGRLTEGKSCKVYSQTVIFLSWRTKCK